MKFKTIYYLAMFVLLFGIIAGCGSSSRETGVKSENLNASAPCISCHAEMYSPQYKDASGSPLPGAPTIASLYQKSLHAENAHGPSCGDCHGVSITTHPAGAPAPLKNPDTSGKCYDCHKDYLKYAPGHYYAYNDINEVGAPAVYVSKNYEKSCSSCHDSHNPKPGQEQKDWAESGHGNVKAAAWSEEDFKNNVACIRCHTATGYVNYIESGFKLATVTWAEAGDKTREVATCKVCHLNNNFKNSVRDIPAYTAPYNSSKSPGTFPDVGASNLCIACHSGRESGDTINAVADFTNASFKNSHYIAAAGLMYMRAGFIDFVPRSTKIGTTTYELTLLPDAVSVPGGITGGVTSTHRKLGTKAINGDSHNLEAFTPGNFDDNGPCVNCHLNATGQPNRITSHTWEINANAFNQICIKCHDSEGGVPLTGANFKKIFLEEQALGFDNTIDLGAKLLLSNYNIKYDPSAYPYFYDVKKDPSGKTAVTDWTRETKDQAIGRSVMGACFNLNLLKKEPAAYVHARTYARRLLYDTIDFLDDGKINLSTGATAIKTSPTIFGKGATAYTDGTLTKVAPGTTESMLYLIGWSRTTGAWNTPERP